MEAEKRVLNVGDRVIYVDEKGRRNNALVNVWHGMKDGETVAEFRTKYNATGPWIPGINLTFVSQDPDKTDPYGRQIERRTSVVHRASQAAGVHGNFFVWPDED